jgi:ferritin-like metal-binding protein YciE
MTQADQKMVQYLNEAHAMEQGLVRVLQSQIAMAPRGSYRRALETHLKETRGHAQRVQKRLAELGQGESLLAFAVGLVESAVAQALALGKTPFDLLRGSGGEEKVLKGAKDACAGEALEIATYMAIERLARAVEDMETATLAASIRADEEKMLERLMREIPKLTEKVVDSDVRDLPSYELSKTGAADAAREAGAAVESATRKIGEEGRRRARSARKVPGVARAEGRVKGALAAEGDLPIGDYSKLTAQEIVERLPELSQIDLAKVDSYERKTDGRSTVLGKIETLRREEPWPGYDELSVGEIRSVLDRADRGRVEKVRSYERSHKNRTGVLDATERELAASA